MAFVGGGLWDEQHHFYLLRMGDLRRVSVVAPLERFVADKPEIVPATARPLHKHLRVRRLLFYDRANGEAGLEVVDAGATRAVQRHFYLHWDLRRGEITEATLVARTRARQSFASLEPIGYDAARRTFYYLRDVRSAKGARGSAKGRRQRTITVVGFVRGKPHVVAQFKASLPLNRRNYLDAAHRRALLVEYAERGGLSPRAHLVDLASGRVRSFAAPVVAYGVAFSSDGAAAYMYSAQTGGLWVVELPSGRLLRRLKVGSLGHALGFVRPGQLLVLRNSGLQWIDARRRRRGRFVPITALYRGFSHVEGSLVLPGRALVKNGQSLYVVALD